MPVETFLLEIGTEELPPKSLRALRDAFAEAIESGLSNAGFSCADITGFATPRRLAAQVMELDDTQPDQPVERRGPALKAAYDDKGQPTKALLGFAKSCGVADPATLDRVSTEKGEWVVYRATEPGKTLDALIADIVTGVLADLPVARRMRWGKHRAEFVRPVKWICALHGGRVVPLELFGLEAGNRSQGHRFMSRGAFTIAHANDYVKACQDNHVIADFDERRSKISEQVQATANEVGGKAVIDEALLDEVTALVEWPVALAGKFDKTFLEVPREALVSAMKEHQRYFHLDDTSGELTNRFITIANIESKDPAVVVRGNERVIRPRLADAAFFYERDSQVPLEEWVERLDQVVFQSELGTYGDKTKRIVELADHIVIALQTTALQVDQALVRRAATLCKADLVTDMVGEFPSLQGIMGGYYARRSGEPGEVSTAISEHYRPVQGGGKLPDTPVGSCVALADKIDTLVGLFGIGQPPSGSSDPFALRRQSLGVIRICIEGGLDLDLGGCLEKAAELHGFKGDTIPRIVEETHDYICERLSNWCVEQGIGGDIVSAVRAGERGASRLASAHQVVATLHLFRKQPVAERIISANKRVANILRKAANENVKGMAGDIDKKLLGEPAEKALGSAVASTRKELQQLDGAEAQLEALAALQPAVDQFFDDVLVMAEDPAVRTNRLRLLSSLRRLFLEVADFSLMQ